MSKKPKLQTKVSTFPLHCSTPRTMDRKHTYCPNLSSITTLASNSISAIGFDANWHYTLARSLCSWDRSVDLYSEYRESKGRCANYAGIKDLELLPRSIDMAKPSTLPLCDLSVLEVVEINPKMIACMLEMDAPSGPCTLCKTVSGYIKYLDGVLSSPTPQVHEANVWFKKRRGSGLKKVCTRHA